MDSEARKKSNCNVRLRASRGIADEDRYARADSYLRVASREQIKVLGTGWPGRGLPILANTIAAAIVAAMFRTAPPPLWSRRVVVPGHNCAAATG